MVESEKNLQAQRNGADMPTPSAPATNPPTQGNVSPRGTYPYGVTGKVAEWDSHAWTGEVHDDTDRQSVVGPWHRHPLGVLKRLWFWLFLAGLPLTIIPAYVSATENSAHLAALFGFAGYTILMVAGVLIISGQLRTRQVAHLWQLVVLGLCSGLAASLVAPAIEGRESASIGLWLAGPIEETLKLLVPFGLLVFGGVRFRDPRAGLLMVMISGAVFGWTEVYGYLGEAKGYEIFAVAVGRSFGEWFHIWLTGFAAAVIWLAAWRAGRAWTYAGGVAWVIIMAVHSLNDGISGLLGGTSKADLNPDYTTLAQAWPSVWQNLLTSVVTVVVLYYLCRYSARELVPPDAVDGNAPGWRPRIKTWGVPGRAGEQSAKSPSTPPA